MESAGEHRLPEMLNVANLFLAEVDAVVSSTEAMIDGRVDLPDY